MNIETVCAVVVTYNRKELLIECLEALRKQTRPLQAIYLIDNSSTDGTPQLLMEKGYIKELPPKSSKESWEKEFEIENLTDGQPIKFHYVRMNENTGGAGGFYEGVKRAYEKGYYWLWLMDDDAEPELQTLELLLNKAIKAKIYAICPLIIDIKGNIQRYHHKKFTFCSVEKSVIEYDNYNDEKSDFIKIDANAFVGPLINRKIIKEIGYPLSWMFIWGDDTEYTLRISKKFSLYLYKKAIIKHKDIGYSKENFKKQKWKVYYAVRNALFIRKKYFPLCFPVFYLRFIISTILSLLKLDFELVKLKIKGLIAIRNEAK